MQPIILQNIKIFPKFVEIKIMFYSLLNQLQHGKRVCPLLGRYKRRAGANAHTLVLQS